jgi:PAS domain S-box-containing protein
MTDVETRKDRLSKQPGPKLPTIKPVVLTGIAALTLTLAACVGIYLQGPPKLQAHARESAPSASAETTNSAAALPAGEANSPTPNLLSEINHYAFPLTIAAAAGSVGLILATLLGISWWRKASVAWLAMTNAESREGVRKVEEVSKELAVANDDLQKEKSQRKRLQDEVRQLVAEMEKRVEDRTATLKKTYAKLEEELNERKHAEKMLAQQAQELERSKDVLELHVQARTQELQKLQRRYEHILNSAGEGIYGLDLQGRTTFVNPAAAKLTGWKVEELIGKQENEVFNHNPSQGETTLMARNGEHLADEVFYRKDRSTFPVEYVKTPILEKEKLVGAVVIFKDITERKRTEDALARKAAELARSNSELEQFAYVASHDLQEPLRKIQAFGDRLKAKCDAVQLQDGRDYLERMQNAAARMQTLINDLLTFSRVISTTQPFVPVNLDVVTKEVLTDLEVRIEQTKARIEVGDLPTIEADPLQMRQLLQNLIGNALKFQPPGAQPVVKIHAQTTRRDLGSGGETEPGDELCELTIQDNGIGFDEKYNEKIFAVFQRLHGRNEYEGTGVGLAVCRRITDRHGGTLHARSKPGEGATFIVTMPVRHGKLQMAA